MITWLLWDHLFEILRDCQIIRYRFLWQRFAFARNILWWEEIWEHRHCLFDRLRQQLLFCSSTVAGVRKLYRTKIIGGSFNGLFREGTKVWKAVHRMGVEGVWTNFSLLLFTSNKGGFFWNHNWSICPELLTYRLVQSQLSTRRESHNSPASFAVLPLLFCFVLEMMLCCWSKSLGSFIQWNKDILDLAI